MQVAKAPQASQKTQSALSARISYGITGKMCAQITPSIGKMRPESFAECKRGERATSRIQHSVHKFMISLLQAANWMSMRRFRLTYVWSKTQELKVSRDVRLQQLQRSLHADQSKRRRDGGPRDHSGQGGRL